MFGDAWRIGAIRGIDIRIHSSWIIIALLVAWSYYTRFAPQDRHGVAASAVMALAAALLFFASVLAHELAHSLEARHRGVQVGGITLFLFGGVTETAFDVQRPRDEFALTAVGPGTSFVLAAAFGIVATYAGRGGLDRVATVSGSLAWVNAALGAFNLLPGAPLDGGRILRSAVWWVTGDRSRAIAVAARAGQLLGALVAGLGLLQLFLVPAGFLGGLWLAFIGWFLFQAARGELAHHRARELLRGRTVGDIVPETPPGLSEDATIRDAVAALTRSPQDVVVLRRDDDIRSVVHVDAVVDVPRSRRDGPAADVAVPVDELPEVRIDDEVVDVLDQLRSQPVVAVRDPGRGIVAMTTHQQLVRALRRAAALEQGAGSRSPRGRRRRGAGHLPQDDAGS